ncbi:HAMP domain-containing sensor histidine kinase [Deinococcus sp. NW-56]|uniref:sensor histidine kinase n=1 Tax=Deinococcus sp. NW-56 TaxID=2080419 RepID=UPI001F1A5BEA|nr:HAMP domain-containing sensor histidine kinase [Deinococcus sp. NW-56]
MSARTPEDAALSAAPAHRVPLWVRAREGLLALLPTVITAVLLLLALQPAYLSLLDRGDGWSIYSYHGLAKDVLQYRAARLDPAVAREEREEIRDQVRSSLLNPAQFEHLAEVEALGDARLSRIRVLVEEGNPQALAEAGRQAVQLSAQAEDLSNQLGKDYAQEFRRLRQVLLGTALVTGLLSMALIVRALRLWRSERERRARREARQREALSLASHELRRPLQSLLLASDLLRQAETPEQLQRLLGMIEESARQLASRADLTRLDDLYLDVTLRVAPSDLRLMVQRVAGGRVTAQVPEEPVVWSVDPDRVAQMLENLIENALKYTSGPVEVALAVEDGQPEITVRDHGPGIPAERRAQMFLPYERGPLGVAPGQGLGLSLVRRYARAHGGDVTLEDAPGGGTLARVRLGEPPLVDERR